MIKLTKKQLKEKYYSQSIKELTKELGITTPTLMRLLKKHNIEKKGQQTKVVIIES
jgi:hypothetical protein